MTISYHLCTHQHISKIIKVSLIIDNHYEKYYLGLIMFPVADILIFFSF